MDMTDADAVHEAAEKVGAMIAGRHLVGSSVGAQGADDVDP
jgi:hypothetical protein